MARQKLTAAMVRAGGNRSKLSSAELTEREALEVSAAPLEPVPPAWMDGSREKVFRETARALAQAGVATELDRDALARYVEAQWQWEYLTAVYDRLLCRGEREEAAKVSKMVDTAFRQARQQGNDLGLSPTARMRVGSSTGPEKPANRFSDLMGGG